MPPRLPFASFVIAPTTTPTVSKAPMEAIFGAMEPMRINPAVLSHPACTDALDDEGHDAEEFSDHSAGAENLVRACAAKGRALTPNIILRERRGGRRYAFRAGPYAGPILPSEGQYRDLVRTPVREGTAQSILLQAIPRALRGAITPVTPGWMCVAVDYKHMHQWLAAWVSGDTRMRTDLRGGDLHATVGRELCPDLPPSEARRVGKEANSRLINLGTAHGLRQRLIELRVPDAGNRAATLHTRWWKRYAGLHAWIEGVGAYLIDMRVRKLGAEFEAIDGSCFSYPPSVVAGMQHDGDPTSAARTIISAIWRSLEGRIMDRGLEVLGKNARKHGLTWRMMLPLYDGLILAAPHGQAADVAALARKCLEAVAAREAGVEIPVTAGVGRSWARAGERAE